MLLSLWVSVLLRHAEINDVNDIGRFRVWSTDEEIVGFDVSIYQVLLVYGLNTGQLRKSEQHRFEGCWA